MLQLGIEKRLAEGIVESILIPSHQLRHEKERFKERSERGWWRHKSTHVYTPIIFQELVDIPEDSPDDDSADDESVMTAESGESNSGAGSYTGFAAG